MRLAIWLLAAACWVMPSQAADVVALDRSGDAIRLRLNDGHADLDWISPSSFRFRRDWLPAPVTRPASNVAPIPLRVNETGTAIEIRSASLTVSISKHPFRLSVISAKGTPLLKQSEAEDRDGDSTRFPFRAAAAERFFGLGPRLDAQVNARGQAIETARAFLLSSLAYGLHFPRSGRYRFDLTHPEGLFSVTARDPPNRLLLSCRQ